MDGKQLNSCHTPRSTLGNKNTSHPRVNFDLTLKDITAKSEGGF